ncbi:MAG: DNA-binding protein [Aquincola sp.]|nr:DNA-binding protein [Aquincola sp.]
MTPTSRPTKARGQRPPTDAAVRTGKQVKADFERTGQSVAEWARKHNVSRSLVYEVIAGRRACKRGLSHRIAVLLGMKIGEIVE